MSEFSFNKIEIFFGAKIQMIRTSKASEWHGMLSISKMVGNP